MAGYTLAEKETQLDEVAAAISAILSGAQSYKLGDRMVSRANLGELEAREKRLEKDIARLSGGRPRVSTGYFTGN